MEPDRICEEASSFLWTMPTLHFILKHASIIFEEIGSAIQFLSIWYWSDCALLTKQCSKNYGSSVLTCSKRSGVVPSSTTFVNHSLSVYFQTYQVIGLLSSSPSIFFEILYLPNSLHTYLTCILVALYHKEMSKGLCESMQVLLELMQQFQSNYDIFVILAKTQILWFLLLRSISAGRRLAILFQSILTFRYSSWKRATTLLTDNVRCLVWYFARLPFSFTETTSFLPGAWQDILSCL